MNFKKVSGINTLLHSTYIDNLHSILHKGKLLSNEESQRYNYNFKGTQGGTNRKICDANIIKHKNTPMFNTNCLSGEAKGCFFLILESEGENIILNNSYETILLFDSSICDTEKCYLNSIDNNGFHFNDTESPWTSSLGYTIHFDTDHKINSKLFSNNIRTTSELIVPNSVDLKYLKKIIIADDYELNLPKKILKKYEHLFVRVTPRIKNFININKKSPYHDILPINMTPKQLTEEYKFINPNIKLIMLPMFMKKVAEKKITEFRIKQTIRLKKKLLKRSSSKKPKRRASTNSYFKQNSSKKLKRRASK